LHGTQYVTVIDRWIIGSLSAKATDLARECRFAWR
jgi:hypothetical protein